MKRPNSVDNFYSQKQIKFEEAQTSFQPQTVSYPDNISQSQAVSFMGNASPALASQNPMATYYMGNTNAYYPTQDMNIMYPQMGAWQMQQSMPQSQSVFDTSRPPPPPLPTSPAPENPPPPPMTQKEIIDTLISKAPPASYFRGRGGYGSFAGQGVYRRGFGKYRGSGFRRGSGSVLPNSSSASQPPHSSVLVKIPLNIKKKSLNLIENARQYRFNGQPGLNMIGDGKLRKCPILHKKKRRKPMSERLPTLEWKREDAERVIELEKEYHAKRGHKAIIVRFPDPKIDNEFVKGFSSSIESVHFQQSAAPRSCIVHLKKGSDVKQVIDTINEIPFGQGMLSAEAKRDEFEEEQLAVEDIDPYTLYIGNFPSDVNVNEVQKMFNTAKKVDVGYAQKMKVTRYGFARYTNVDDAIAAYKINFNATYKSRSIIVRFRRNNRSIGLDGDRRPRKKEDDQKQLAEEEKLVEETNEEVAAEVENESDDCEDEMEDTKSGVFDYANNMMLENWYSDDMYESDDNQDEPSPNLTGLIKNEPDEYTCNYFLCSEEDDDLHQRDNTSNNQQITPPMEIDKTTNNAKQGNAGGTSAEVRKNRVFPNLRQNGAYFSKSLNWEEIRQKELNDTEEKPDIQSLEATSSTPIGSYGLVPMILPKEENEEENLQEGVVVPFRGTMFNQGLRDFEKSLREDDTDNIDAAFESAWNDFEAN